ncbi:hypothetical protein [Asticcacaulis sp.]|uniref:hypothetical protein n=1 Tax=Asticcacaulis sp. TaxID=1872648 RepID=UPI002606B311|nr:hypothetical protein [Asticcacaulis sp.]
MGRREDSENAWRKAIDDAYEVFASYRRPGGLAVSPAENAEALLADLTSAPLRDLTPQKLDNFAGSALYTVGSQLDYKHFLPRILELMVSAQGSGFDASLTARKLDYAHFKSWPADEIATVRQVFRAAWPFVCYAPFTTQQLPDLLVGNRIVGNEVFALLSQFEAVESDQSVMKLCRLVRAVLEMDERDFCWSQLTANDRVCLETWSRSEAVTRALFEGLDFVAGYDAWDVELTLQLLERF